MSEADSFIEEVTEEVKRDQLFGYFKRYGWIVGAIVVLAVGGAAYNEWRKADEKAAAQALGDAVAAAVASNDAAARAEGVALIEAANSNAKIYLEMLQAAEFAMAEDKAGALTLLDGIAASADAPETYRSLAMLKAVMLRGADQDMDARMAVLDTLATPGNAFRAIAMEQKALVFIENGNNDEAIALLLTLLDEPQVTGALRSRAQQVIVSLGGDLPTSRLLQQNDE